MAKTNFKNMARAKHPEAFCVDLSAAADSSERGYVVYNHGRINEGGYAQLGFGRSAGAAWKQASLAKILEAAQ